MKKRGRPILLMKLIFLTSLIIFYINLIEMKWIILLISYEKETGK